MERKPGEPDTNADLQEILAEKQGLENLLVEYDTLLRRAQSVAGVGSWHLDIVANQLTWSEEAYRLFGVPGGTPMTLEKFLDCIHPDDQQEVLQAWSDTVERDAPYDIEHRVVVDGKVRWVRERAEITRDQDGKPLYGIGTTQDITQRKLLEIELRKSEGRFRALVETSSDWVWEVDEQGVYTYASPQVEALLGYTPGEMLGRTPFDFMPPGEAERVGQRFKAFVASCSRFTLLENVNLHKNGRRVVLETSGSPFFDATGRFCGYRGIDRDITERRRAEDFLRDSEARFRTLFEQSPDPAWILRDNKAIASNQAAVDMFGYPDKSSFDQTHPAEFSPPFQPDGESSRTKADRMIALAVERGVHRFEWTHRRWDESTFDAEVTLVPVVLEGLPSVYAIVRDISERKRNEEQIRYLAYHDQLTGMPNRMIFLDRLLQALATAERHQWIGAVMFMDLDHFKQINDVHGHSAGDRVLKEVAGRLPRQLGKDDTVARLGGDEFVILLPELAGETGAAAAQALDIGERLRASVEKPMSIEGQEYDVTCSIGISLFPKRGDDQEDLIRQSDIAMYRAKDYGRNTVVFFERDMQQSIAERYALEKELRKALRDESLEIHLQSQVDAGGRVVGAEALVRWGQRPADEPIPPAIFIPVAEESGMISAIGDFVLREACRVIQRLCAAGRGMNIAVNVSPRQFHMVDFVSKVTGILEETGAEPRHLTLEITESLLLDRAEEVVSRMHELSALGIRFSIDDFGTGYSSLAYLKRLPLDELKIDKSFVQDVPGDVDDAAVIEAILPMAHHLGMTVIAEGVENQAQFDFLVRNRCDHFQGYHFQRPMPVADWMRALEGR